MTTYTLPLFPLNTVIFPEGILSLKVFETRYLDMIRKCLSNKTSFGLVALYPDNHVNLSLNVDFKSDYPFAKIGTSFNIIEADVSCLGLINIKSIGKERFKIISAAQAKDGLWIAEVENLPTEYKMDVPDDLSSTQTHLKHIIESLGDHDISELELPIAKPFHLNDCAWVANRWCEILNMPLIQKQRMLELDSPLVRLELIQDMLIKEFSNEP